MTIPLQEFIDGGIRRDGVLFSNPQAFDGSFLGYRALAGAMHQG